MVITRCDIRDQRPKGIERRATAPFLFLLIVDLDLVQRNVSRALDHDLDIVIPGALAQLTDGLQLRELGGVVSVGDGARPQTVPQGERDVVGREDLAQLVEVFVEEGLLVVGQAPARHDRPAAGDDARDALGGQRHEGKPHTSVHGHVVHALLGLLDDRVAENLPGQVLGHTTHLLQCLVDRNGADRNRGVA